MTKLSDPIMIRGMRLKNRIVMPPMYTKFATDTGAMSQRMIDFYVERAKGGVAMITVENTCVDWPLGKAGTNPLRIDNDNYVAGLHDLAEAVHDYDCCIATNPQHTGRQTDLESSEGQLPVAPSPIPVELHLGHGGAVPRELTVEEIDKIEDKFAQAARRTKLAGCDAIELHAAHGYLVTQFMSPFSNRRTDRYGGTREGRLLFAVEVVQRMREQVGDFPIIFRFTADELIEGGITLDDSKFYCPRLEEAGVDAFHVSGGSYDAPWGFGPTFDLPFGMHLHAGEEIKKVVNVPIITVGRIIPELAKEIIESGKADIVAIGRPLIADPEWPRKVLEGRLEDVRPCTYCNSGDMGNIFKQLPITCQVNPDVGKEAKKMLKPTESPKSVMVIGGGPAGMEAAWVAATRGHHVTLFEKEDKLWGQMKFGSLPEFKSEYRKYLRWIERKIHDLGVEVKTGVEVTKSLVSRSKPDVVIVATGAQPSLPEIAGIDSKNVATASDVLSGSKQLGDDVIIAGGGDVGCEVAWWLSEQGKRVTIVEQLGAVAMDLNDVSKAYLTKKLKDLGVKIMVNSFIEKITNKGVVVIDKTWKRKLIECGCIVVALGSKSNTALLDELKGEIANLYAVGDCVKPRTMLEAINEGHRVACEI